MKLAQFIFIKGDWALSRLEVKKHIKALIIRINQLSKKEVSR